MIDVASAAVTPLLEEIGEARDFRMRQLPTSGNNRVFRVDLPNRSLLLKAYFHSDADPRDRLGAEFLFTSFAWSHGLDMVPRPLAVDRANHLGLYEFVDGRRLEPEEIDWQRVSEALRFYRALNAHPESAAAWRLPAGSEAWFTMEGHLSCLERRLAGLQATVPESDTDREAAEFIATELAPAAAHVAAQVRSSAARLNQSLTREIPSEDRRLSPSDFGYHNAILRTDGRLTFVDFEYAGWDDPAKMVCDFFCAPAVPVPMRLFRAFAEAAVADLSSPEMHFQRIELLLPVYQLKWCCIMLNEFQPAAKLRRRFSGALADEDNAKQAQLAKASAALAALSNS
ncbi:MAG TPA: phosphotransferase [Chloroflexota bacterium]|nr:phosphotransferase [Chloroflexota bacterium]